MAVIKSGASTDQMTVDATSKAARMTPYDSAGREVSDEKVATFAASGAFTPPATPADLVFITGSATKTVRVRSMRIGTTNTAAGSQQFVLSKRSAAATGGTEVAATVIPVDSANSAGTAVVKHVTTSANTPGTALGNINTKRVASPAAIPATWAGIVTVADVEMLPRDGDGKIQPVVLRGVAEALAINFAGAALVSGQTHVYSVVWSEE